MSITKFFILNDGKNISREEQVVNIDIFTLKYILQVKIFF
jgi:hypothetical protein